MPRKRKLQFDVPPALTVEAPITEPVHVTIEAPRDVWLWHIDADRHRHALRLRFQPGDACTVTAWPAVLWDRGQWPAPENYHEHAGTAWGWATSPSSP